MSIVEVALPPVREPCSAKIFIGNTVVLANEARVLVCAIDETWITGIVLQGTVGNGYPVMVQPTAAARFRRHAVASRFGDVSFDFNVNMAHDARQDVVLRCRRTSHNEIELKPMATRRRPMPSIEAQVNALDRVFGCWSTLCEFGLQRGALPSFSDPHHA